MLIVKAKVMIGFDLTKINFDLNSQKKLVHLTRFPEPEILSIDSDLEYYDIQKGIINKINATDLTNMNKRSKECIREKVEQSHLVQIAKNQANDTIGIVRQLIESVGWEFTAEHQKLNAKSTKGKLV